VNPGYIALATGVATIGLLSGADTFLTKLRLNPHAILAH
jgi:hypothetical protein